MYATPVVYCRRGMRSLAINCSEFLFIFSSSFFSQLFNNVFFFVDNICIAYFHFLPSARSMIQFYMERGRMPRRQLYSALNRGFSRGGQGGGGYNEINNRSSHTSARL